MSALGDQTRLLVGNIILLAAVLLAVAGVLTPEVATPAQRVLASIASGLDSDRADDQILMVESLQGIRRGLPVFLLDGENESRPVAHVLDSGENGMAAWVHLRFEPGEDPTGAWRLISHAPDRKLRSALDMAVTDEAARRFGGEVSRRLETLWDDVILPDLKQRLPGFLDRIDPSEDTEARKVMVAVSKRVMTELDPLLDELARYVTRAVRKKMDLLDRLGLLVDVVQGDSKGLSKKILPVAKEAARRWWDENQARVLKAVGDAFAAEFDTIRDWAAGELFDAAREELAEPILTARRKRLEDEGEALLRLAADEFVRAPEGGFRVRFAAVLRTQLLNKRTALLLLERMPAPR